MARTVIGVNDPKAVKKWSGLLTLDTSGRSYFNSRFMARGNDVEVPVQILTDLESDSGDRISYDLLAEMCMSPVIGDDVLENKEEAQKFYTDEIYIDQVRCGADAGNRMTRKRTLHDLRALAKRQQADWWARLMDELLFVYLGGGRGVNPDYLLSPRFTGYASNSVSAPDSDHILYSGTVTDESNMTTGDKFGLAMVDAAKTKATTQGGGNSGIPAMQPCKIGTEETFVCVMHPFQEEDLRTGTAAGDWLQLQKAAAGSDGQRNPIFRGSLGVYRGVILHSHKKVTRYAMGSGGSVPGARALFLGAQAGAVAYGSPGTGLRYNWHEETRDNGNRVVITSSALMGVKKVTYDVNGAAKDFGVIALSSAAAVR